jgi:hypothetical protein
VSNQPSHPPDLTDWSLFVNDDIELSSSDVELSAEQVNRALEISEPIVNSRRRWQTYLNALALIGFEQWLEEWASDLAVADSNCSVYQPEYANLFEGVANLQVGQFKLCLIISSGLSDTVVSVSRAVIDLPQFVPHFYVWMEVLEEQMQVRVCGYLRHDQLVHQQQVKAAAISSEWAYLLPLDWFILSPNVLLLELHHLEATKIPLPSAAPKELLSTTQLRSKLVEVHTQLCSSKYLAEEVLTWQEGATLLMHPEIVNELYRQSIYRNQQPIDSPSGLAQHTINVGCWLQGQLDRFAQELSWVLMPPFAFADSMLRSTAAFDEVASELANRGISIPSGARGAYQDLRESNSVLRLYAVTWAMPFTQQEPEWTLLLTLGTPTGARIPIGTRLQIRDATQLLAESVATADRQDSYLCIQVAGSWAEQFRVTVESSNGVATDLPPFAFNPDKV